MKQSEVTKKTTQKTNLEQLRDLVEVLETQQRPSDSYDTTLELIQSVINEEQKVINKLKRNDSKIKHYELICSSIMTIIGATN